MDDEILVQIACLRADLVDVLRRTDDMRRLAMLEQILEHIGAAQEIIFELR